MSSANISLGAFSVTVLSPINDNLRCLLCCKVLENPHQSLCGCRFCLSCVEDFLQSGDKTCPGKTEYCLELDVGLLRPDILARREINKIVVKCCMSSCDEESNLLEMKDHLERCSLSTVKCNECGEDVTRGEFRDHGATSCGESLVRCDSCNETMKRRLLEQEHHNFCHDNMCVSYVNRCPNECEENNEVLWVEHRRICSKKCVPCPYKVIGCTANDVQMTNMPRHMLDNEFCHAEFLVKETENISNEMASINRAVVTVSEEVRDIKEETISLQNQIRDINVAKCSTEEMRSLNLRMRGHVSTTIAASTKVASDAQALSIGRLTSDMEKMRREMQGENVLLRGEVERMKLRIAALETKVREKGVAFVWTVDKFSKTHNLVGPEFYTHPRGYKMNMMFQKKKKGFLSIYVTLLCGDYDAELPWPFRKKITMRILDQEKLGRDIEQCFTINALNGSAFERKFTMSKNYLGVEDFVSYSDLRAKSYLLMNNRLLILCLVEETGNT